jgi:hypothetical protein
VLNSPDSGEGVAKRRGRVDVLGEVHMRRQHFFDKEL